MFSRCLPQPQQDGNREHSPGLGGLCSRAELSWTGYNMDRPGLWREEATARDLGMRAMCPEFPPGGLSHVGTAAWACNLGLSQSWP